MSGRSYRLACIHEAYPDAVRPHLITSEPFTAGLRVVCSALMIILLKPEGRLSRSTTSLRSMYNEFRPHSAIGKKVPISLMNGSSAPPST